ncbi:TIGR00366 family protein, partial [Nocardioides sp.]|uniref:TIGR00366 family protein n=1 Tax=Nocardioides sp. TaxID=35761 RepID=UPI002736E6D5
YAGILGMIVATGLSEKIAGAFSAVANDHTYPLFVYWYSAALNFLVPSGGSKFAVEAPYLAEAAQTLNVPLDLTVVAYMWGDMATNAVQPFWALPLLAMCGLGFRDIMGFLVVFAMVIVTIGSAAFLIAPFLF